MILFFKIQKFIANFARKVNKKMRFNTKYIAKIVILLIALLLATFTYYVSKTKIYKINSVNMYFDKSYCYFYVNEQNKYDYSLNENIVLLLDNDKSFPAKITDRINTGIILTDGKIIKYVVQTNNIQEIEKSKNIKIRSPYNSFFDMIMSDYKHTQNISLAK